jgi:selenocysteine-specific elongation factor
MLVGALGTDVALLCVAADEGVMPQTREHFLILRLLPVEQLVVALTRADLADNETLTLAELDVHDLLAGTRFEGSPVIPVSAVTGQGLDALRRALDAALGRAARDRTGPWYLPIDRAFTMKGQGAVITGTLAQGEVRVGEAAWLEPLHREVRVRSIHTHGQAVDRAEAGQRTALNLGGIRLEELDRGMAVGAAGALFASDCIDLDLDWVQGHEAKHGSRVRLSVGAEEAIGKLFLNDHDARLAQVRLTHPVAVALGQPVILRRHSPMDVLGGGKVLVPLAKPRRRTERIVRVESDNLEGAVAALLARFPEGVRSDEICRQLGRTPQALGPIFEALQASGRAYGFAGLWFSHEGFRASCAKFLTALESLHAESPRAAFHAREAVVKRSGLAWAGKPLDRIIARLAQEGEIDAEGTEVKRKGFAIALTEKQQALLHRVENALVAAGVNVPGVSELATLLHVPPQAIQEILRLGVEAGRLVRLDEGIYYTDEQLETFREAIRQLTPPFAASDVRDALQTSRKYVIPLLEYLDSTGFTLRHGDRRVVR